MAKILTFKGLRDGGRARLPQNPEPLGLTSKILQNNDLRSAMDSLLPASPLGNDGPLLLWKARSDVTLIVEFAVENAKANREGRDFSRAGKFFSFAIS